MRNISKMMYEQAAKDEFLPNGSQRQRQSKFLDVEEPILSPMIPLHSFFNECGDDYKPDMNFVNEPY